MFAFADAGALVWIGFARMRLSGACVRIDSSVCLRLAVMATAMVGFHSEVSRFVIGVES
jgi:hypothetical protein